MTKTEIYRKAFRELEKERDGAEKLSKKRISEIYELIPEVRNIDEQIMRLNVDFARAALKKNKDRDIAILKKKNSELLLEKENILKQYGIDDDFFASVYKCKKCRDTGYIGNKKCDCLKKRLIEAAYDMSNIKGALEYENFEKFELSFYSSEIDEYSGKSPRERIEAILIRALDFVENFDSVFTNLYLYGKSGLGKTFLCNCIAKAILDTGKSVLYLSAAQLFKMLEKNTFNNDDEFGEVLRLIFDAELLIIDDLGTEFQTAFTASEFFNIINMRYIKKRPVVISTNLSPQDIIDKYSDRIVSRFYGNYDFLEFLGDDIRILKLSKG